MKEIRKIKIAKIQDLRMETYEGIQKKYAPLFLDVIEENLKLEGEFGKILLDQKMLEELLLTKDAHFLTNEFGRSLLEFPEQFILVCNRLYKTFQGDFPYASIVDSTKINKVYSKNYRSPNQYYYYMNEYDEPRIILRELIVKFVSKLEIKPFIQKYTVSAKNEIEVFNANYQLVIKIYICFKNDYPHIFKSKPYSTPISEEKLKKLEELIVRISRGYEWGNEMNYDFGDFIKSDLLKIAPELKENMKKNDSILKLFYVPDRYINTRYSHQIDDLPKINNFYTEKN
jgi:hypothetical protein